MTFSFVQGRVNQGSGTTQVFDVLTSTPAAGNVVCVALLFFGGTGGGTTTVVDGDANSYTMTPMSPSTYAAGGQMYLAYRVITGTPTVNARTITATFTNTYTVCAMWLEEFSCTSGTPTFDTEAKATGTGATVNTPSVTPAAAGSLLFGAAAFAGTITGAGAPFTGATGGTSFGCEEEYYLDAPASAQAMNFATSGSNDWSSIMMAMRDGAAGPAPRIVTPTTSVSMGR
jgi:hypothetical protein